MATIASKEPVHLDIVLGRGKKIFGLPGSIRYRQLITKHRSRFQRAARKGPKGKIIEEVYNEVLHGHGIPNYVVRFWQPLKKKQSSRGRKKEHNEGRKDAAATAPTVVSYTEVGKDAAMKKVHHALREKVCPREPLKCEIMRLRKAMKLALADHHRHADHPPSTRTGSPSKKKVEHRKEKQMMVKKCPAEGRDSGTAATDVHPSSVVPTTSSRDSSNTPCADHFPYGPGVLSEDASSATMAKHSRSDHEEHFYDPRQSSMPRHDSRSSSSSRSWIPQQQESDAPCDDCTPAPDDAPLRHHLGAAPSSSQAFSFFITPEALLPSPTSSALLASTRSGTSNESCVTSDASSSSTQPASFCNPNYHHPHPPKDENGHDDPLLLDVDAISDSEFLNIDVDEYIVDFVSAHRDNSNNARRNDRTNEDVKTMPKAVAHDAHHSQVQFAFDTDQAQQHPAGGLEEEDCPNIPPLSCACLPERLYPTNGAPPSSAEAPTFLWHCYQRGDGYAEHGDSPFERGQFPFCSV
mmetsp:Transcript_7284/g.21392  ORF Transcript_7284/g.21392 Transcript_7284/m.21392 type:complete len:521 (+) Transcript_7284:374-1936(+)